jgi:putative transposase
VAITTETKPEPTIWRIPDDVWEIVEEVLVRRYPKHAQDRKRVPLRPVLDGILYRLRTGCQWNHLPKEFGDDSTVHRHFQAWCALGVFDEIWRELLLRCEELDGIQWKWQSVDGSMGKAIGKSKMPDDEVGKNPTDRGKNG